ncbi:hypothetical protein ACLOJK_002866 [Asimina triloba]
MAQAEDKMLDFSHPYPTINTQTSQVEGKQQVRRRHRKNERGVGGEGGMMMKKRRLSEEQAKLLELSFWKEHKLESRRRERLAMELGLEPQVISVWFQNRRARWKAKQVEEEYQRLKAIHHTVLVDKCRLEAEVIKLKKEISEAKEEIKKLSKGFAGGEVLEREASCSSSSSLTKDSPMPFLAAGFDVEESGNFMFIPDFCCTIDDLEWVPSYGLI